ncbi:MAG TPA: cohesin domain-containing protein, partial [Bacteroidales bacterium]|nr:cohesin domain-containing protein [Bacteroidales bacterium]
MKRITALVAALLFAVVTYGQPIVTSVGNLTVCTETVVVPVEVVKVSNVGAISLVLQYNPAVLTYVGYQNQHPSLAIGYSTVVNQVGNKIYFSWHAISPLNILQG